MMRTRGIRSDDSSTNTEDVERITKHAKYVIKILFVESDLEGIMFFHDDPLVITPVKR